MCSGCNGFAGDEDDTAVELGTVVASADPCKTWNVIFTFVLGKRSVHLAYKHANN